MLLNHYLVLSRVHLLKAFKHSRPYSASFDASRPPGNGRFSHAPLKGGFLPTEEWPVASTWWSRQKNIFLLIERYTASMKRKRKKKNNCSCLHLGQTSELPRCLRWRRQKCCCRCLDVAASSRSDQRCSPAPLLHLHSCNSKFMNQHKRIKLWFKLLNSVSIKGQ